MSDHILVIKLSALGDFVQNFGLMRAIRKHHPNSKISLLTTKPYKNLGESSGYFDNIIVDERPKFHQLGKWFALKKKLKQLDFSIVYDLQSNDRSRLYHSLLLGKNVQRISPDKNADKNKLAFYRHAEVLKNAGISSIDIDRMEWMDDDLSDLFLPEKYALIVPGCAPTRPEKRWPASGYIEICHHLLLKGITPVVLGTQDEADVTQEITTTCAHAIDLTGKTKLTDIPALGRNAVIAVGNDTGPMHMIGPTGCQTLVLFSGYSEPHRHKPLGENVKTLQKKELNDLTADTVIQSMIVS